MESSNSAFDDFLDHCLIAEDAICRETIESRLGHVTSQLISELIAKEEGLIGASINTRQKK